MVGIKNYNKGFYKEFIELWIKYNPKNKPLKVSEIQNLFKEKEDKDFIQPKIYKTLVALNQNKLSNYDNLKWNLNYKNLLLVFQIKRENLNKTLNTLKDEILGEIKDLKYLERIIVDKKIQK